MDPVLGAGHSTSKDTECFSEMGVSLGKDIKDIYPEEIRNCLFHKRTDTYKVWLYGGKSKKNVPEESEPTTPKQEKKRKSSRQ